ncbi:hypothetical protein BIZ37_05835 [Photobacterium sp. BZF1]|uniref:hypothetical protein n=1 Tax=Photobacterium sp. BZF1 TaxID=1904457 RepID=UPI00165394B9|nr:hypothetical protein [Photobacterium sp. BZF1]MBC7002068.1 hypothetical protein [Photobacterium sp. BZF1]
MKNISKAIIPILLSFSTSTFATFDMDIYNDEEATWVRVTKNGVPVPNAKVTSDHTGGNTFITDERGETFLFTHSIRTGSVNFVAVNDSGETISKMYIIDNNG